MEEYTNGVHRHMVSGRGAARLLLLMLFVCLCGALQCRAVPADPREAAPLAAVPQDSLTVSVVTCWPGPEIYELCGHSALRIRGERFDSVWNYGVFDFREPNFVYRFVKGETDYMVAGYPFAWFLPEYMARGSHVEEQVLDLTQDEARKLRSLLQRESLPANRKYRYNYVLDNCATRIYDRVGEASDQRMELHGAPRYGSFRREMKAYHSSYPWYQFGIDVALGSGLDRPIGMHEEMFVPVEMHARLDSATWTDGRPVVRARRILYEGRTDAVLPPTPWWLTPLFWSFIVLALAIVIAVLDWRRGRPSRWWYTLLFTPLGLAGCLVAFLVFCSSHEATAPNILLLWLNPLQLVPAVCVWWRAVRPLATAMCVCDVVTVLCLMVGWAFQPQGGNAAFFPLMAATLVSAGTYAIITLGHSYKSR